MKPIAKDLCMPDAQFIASVIHLKPECEEQYKILHKHTFPEVLRRISLSNINDYSIFLHGGVLFSHMQYVGHNLEQDMQAIGTDETTREWWKLTDKMQQPVEGRKPGEWWATLQPMASVGVPMLSSKWQRMAFSIDPFPSEGTGSFPWAELFPEGAVKVYQGLGQTFLYIESARQPDEIQSILYAHLPTSVQASQMEMVFHTETPSRKKVFVSGCFDMLHSGHIAFLTEASGYGDLYVCIGSDNNVHNLKGRFPVISESERRYLIQALACVTECRISKGWGLLDFVQEMLEIKPDIFIVNEDGHTPAKEELCQKSGIEYHVLKRVPYEGLPVRSTTALRTECTIPFRIDLAGGWLDQPFVSEHAAGPVITISIEPTHSFNGRSGMASSTRIKAIELWQASLPAANPEQLGKILFSFENPPGTATISGSQDSLGIVLPGLNRLFYQNNYWPSDIGSVHDEDILSFIEDHLYLITLGPRQSSYNVLENTSIHPEGAMALSAAAEKCWNALLAKDLKSFGAAMRMSFEAQVAMFPHMSSPDVESIIERYRDHALGWKLSGAGGGGYLILVCETPLPEAIQIKIRRKNAP